MYLNLAKFIDSLNIFSHKQYVRDRHVRIYQALYFVFVATGGTPVNDRGVLKYRKDGTIGSRRILPRITQVNLLSVTF